MRRLFVTDEAVCCHANDAPFDAHLREAQAHLFKCYVATGPSTSEACARAKALHLTARCDSRLETASGSMGPSLTRMDVALQLAAVRVQLTHMCVQAGPPSNEAHRIVVAEPWIAMWCNIIPARGPASAATHHHSGGPQAKAGSRPYLFGTVGGGLPVVWRHCFCAH